jgi:hypothetical protein
MGVTVPSAQVSRSNQSTFAAQAAAIVMLVLLAFSPVAAQTGQLTVVTPTGASSLVSINITGTGFHTTAANNEVSFVPANGAPMTALATAIATVDATRGLRRITVRVPAGLPPGTTALRVRDTVNGTISEGRSLQVIALSLPDVTSASPGTTNLDVRVVGSANTTFIAGKTQIGFGTGITVNSVTVRSPTELIANINVPASVAPSVRTLQMSSAQLAVLPGAFTIAAPPPPALTSVSPAVAQQGQTLAVTVNGEFTHFNSATQVSFGSGTIVESVTVGSPTELMARVRVDRQAIVGLRAVAVTSGSESLSLPDVLAVSAGPTITASADRPPNDAGWYSAPVTVTFTCTDPLNPITTCPDPQTVSGDGANQVITGSATNSAGVGVSTSISLSIDATPPTILFTSPAAGSRLFVPEVAAAANVADALSGLTAATCGGAPALVNNSAIACAEILEPGANDLVVTAADAAGNTATSTLSLIYARAPSVVITSPESLAYLNLSPTTVTGTVDDATAVVNVNGLNAPVSAGQFSVLLPIAEGPTIIAATATASSGATGSDSISVTLDTTAPHVSITSPADRFRTTAETIAVAGIVNDIVVGTVNPDQAQVTVNGLPASVANRTFLRTSVPLAPGDNVIEAVGRDRVGNTVTAQITVTRDPATEPHILVVSGNHQSGPIGSTLPVPLTVALFDAAGNPAPNVPVIFKVVQDDGLLTAGATPQPTVAVTTDAQGRAEARWTLGHRAGAGSDAVEAYAVGFNGTALFAASALQGVAAKIVVDTGNDQIGAVGQVLPKPLIAVVVDEGNNRLSGVPVIFSVLEGGGNFDGQPSATLTSDSDGRVAATLTLGLQEGNANNVVAATFAGNTGLPAGFTASGRVPGDPAATTISGVVLDNNNEPIEGVTLRAVLTSLLNSNRSIIPTVPAVQTDAHGQFMLPNAPVGHAKLLVDGLTAAREGTYPMLEYDMVTVAGQDNTVGQPIYLLPLSTVNQLCVTPTSGGGTLTIPEAPGFSLTFNPGQVTFPGGSQTGCVSVTVVHGDKVPMVPGFGQQPRFIVTIQPSGAHFNPPAQITLPNVDGLKPREVTEMYSFDHDIQSFVAIGTGVVSDDGLVIRSSPGVGVLKAGWHCGGNPTGTGTAALCATCKMCNGTSCVPDPAGGQCNDNKFCTTQDTCVNGVCSGTPKPDVPGTPVTLNFNLDPLLQPIQGFAQSVLGSSIGVSVQVGGSYQEDEHCCDQTQSNVTNKTVSGTISGSIGLNDIPIPGLAVALPFGIHAGLFASIGVNASGTLTGSTDNCTNATNGSVAASIGLSGTISAQLTLPASIASASAGGTIGASCSFSGPLQTGSIPFTGICGSDGVVLNVSATFVNGVIQASTSFVVMPPAPLGSFSFTLPVPF